MSSSRKLNLLFPHFQFLALCGFLWFLCGWQSTAAQTDWPFVGGDAGGMRYSALNQISRKNVKDLQVAWTFHTGPHNFPYGGFTDPSIQCTPVVIDSVMYLTSADTQVIALDAATGRELWRFNPHRTKDGHMSNRGVAYWSDGRRGGVRRILFAIPDGRLFSLDARTGKPDPAFGRQGVVELREGIERDLSELRYGATWSGASFDPTTGLLYVNANDMPWLTVVTPVEAKPGLYQDKGNGIFRDQDGFPASKPPWGTLNAIDLNRGEIKWQAPLGEWPGAVERGLKNTGTENFGGSLVTAGGLVFIASTMDEKFRAFDKATGRLLWEHALPAAGYAAPCTYTVNGRQYVVIAAGGGGKPKTKAGDAYVAFALPHHL